MKKNFPLVMAAIAVMTYCSSSLAGPVIGVDISSVTEYEADGYTWVGKDGKKGDLFRIMRDYGAGAVRLRVWVDPKDGWCNLEDTVVKAKRAAAHGMDVMVDFHYSDDWADPGKQRVPKAWSGKPVDEVKRLFAAHTREVLEALKREKVSVKWVQIGNEVAGGMLWTPRPNAEGHTEWEEIAPGSWSAKVTESYANDQRNPEAFAEFFRLGAATAKSVYPEAKVIIHLTPACKIGAINPNLELLTRLGADVWDVIGLSLYTQGERPEEAKNDARLIPSVDDEILRRAIDNIRETAVRWKKPVMIVETGFETHPVKPMMIEYSAWVMSKMMRAVRTELADVCEGVFYWEPGSPDSRYHLGAYREEHWHDKVLYPTPIMDAFVENRTRQLSLAERLAATGIVLLKNDGEVLPLAKGSEVALVGFTSYYPVRMGCGSGDMFVNDPISYDAGFEARGLKLAKGFREFYREERSRRMKRGDYDRLNRDWEKWSGRFAEPAEMTEEKFAELAAECPCTTPCVVTIGRCAGEAMDMRDEPGSFRLAEEERTLIASACRNFEKVIVLLNTPGPIDVSFLDEFPVKGLVHTSLLGEASGLAVADVVAGWVNPSGRTVDTWAKHYADYPSALNFGGEEVKYDEGVFVGYRHFDKRGVEPRFPFGYGLSYTRFEYIDSSIRRFVDSSKDETRYEVEVKNVGKRKGAEVVQYWLEEDGRMLAGFAKTKYLKPGESEKMTITVSKADVTSGGGGKKIFAERIDERVKNLSDEELVEMVHGRIFDGGMAVEGGTGVGGAYKGKVQCEAGETAANARLGVRPVVFADGGSGVRLSNFGDGREKYNPVSRSMTGWPCASAIAQSWSVEGAEAFGRALAADMEKAGVDGILAPGLNIHRNPLCGRNFEYFSEDPLLAGKMGAGVVRGIQTKKDGSSSGKIATVKHFATNNQEAMRNRENNVVDEKTLRAIYLKPFEIVVREAKPKAIMASYNKLNGEYCSTSKWLLTDVLRGEWGFDGLVMTDWWTAGDKNLHPAAGCDLTMPGVREERERMLQALRSGAINRADLERAASRVLRLAE